jgi:hypothetical protein
VSLKRVSARPLTLLYAHLSDMAVLPAPEWCLVSTAHTSAMCMCVGHSHRVSALVRSPLATFVNDLCLPLSASCAVAMLGSLLVTTTPGQQLACPSHAAAACCHLLAACQPLWQPWGCRLQARHTLAAAIAWTVPRETWPCRSSHTHRCLVQQQQGRG